MVVTQPSWACTVHILDEQAEPVLGIVGSVVGLLGVAGDQLVGVVGVVVGDQAGPGYCGQGLLQASHSLPLRLSGPILPFSVNAHC